MADAVAERLTGAESVIWDLSVLYHGLDDDQIQADMDEIERRCTEFQAKYQGKVGSLAAPELLAAYVELEAIAELRGRPAVYASLNFSTFSADPAWGAFVQKINEFGSQMSQKTVFFQLEWNAVDDDNAAEILADPVLGSYRYHLESARRYKPHQLTEPEEKILLEKNVTGSGAWVRFFNQLTSSMTYDLNGEKLSQAQILSKLYLPDRDLRQQAANSFTAGLREKSMELTYVFNTLAADKFSDDKLRRYPSWVSSRNLSNKAPDAVVEALIATVTASYDLVARHYRVKKALLGYDELYDYDRYAPLDLKPSEMFYEWMQAKQIVVDAYHGFSPNLGTIAARFFDENWIHAPLLKGKRGGAYCSYGTKSTHPFVFMNYSGIVRDVTTLAHELGHGLHAYLAGKAQSLFGMATPLTTAETASVFGEMIVFQDLMQREPDAEVRLSMLAGKLEDTFATVFRQIAMNRFEDALHMSRRDEGELTTQRLGEIWMETQQAMFQGSVTLREEYSSWWSYVPHFLATPGYVYAYSFGELLVLALYNLYRQRGSAFVPQYEALLAAGDSDYPANLLAKVGVNLDDPAFWNEGISAIRRLVDEEEALAKQLYPGKF